MPKRERLERPQASLLEDIEAEMASPPNQTWENLKAHLGIYAAGIFAPWILANIIFSEYTWRYLYWTGDLVLWTILGMSASMLTSGILTFTRSKETKKVLPKIYAFIVSIIGSCGLVYCLMNLIYRIIHLGQSY